MTIVAVNGGGNTPASSDPAPVELMGSLVFEGDRYDASADAGAFSLNLDGTAYPDPTNTTFADLYDGTTGDARKLAGIWGGSGSESYINTQTRWEAADTDAFSLNFDGTAPAPDATGDGCVGDACNGGAAGFFFGDGGDGAKGTGDSGGRDLLIGGDGLDPEVRASSDPEFFLTGVSSGPEFFLV
jgi:hypothetical protein